MNWPYLTDSKLFISGTFKQTPEDFEVDEIPLYPPSGSGEHLYLLIEKRNLTTDQVVRKLSQQLNIPAKNIGFAGKKDRAGVTRQWISLLGADEHFLLQLNIAGLTILEMNYHRNKLRPGHLRGNRFRIRLRNVPDGAEGIVRHLLAELQERGVPNYFGPQRFGRRGDNALIGAALLKEDWQTVFDHILGFPGEDEGPGITEARQRYHAGDFVGAARLWPQNEFFPRTALRLLHETGGDADIAGRRLPKNMLKFYANALQSLLFNNSLARRLPHVQEIWPGDLAYLHRNGAVFLVTDAEQEQPRADRFEISPSGPIWGPKMIEPEGAEAGLETAVLLEMGLSRERLFPGLKRWRIPGERRAYRVPLTGADFHREGKDLLLQFSLPPGSYATAVLRELMKDRFPEVPVPGASGTGNAGGPAGS